MADLLDVFKSYAYKPIHLLDTDPFKPVDSELNRTLETSKAVILRMLGRSVTTLNLPIEAVKAIGILTANRANPDDETIINIPMGQKFNTSLLVFESIEVLILNESQRFIPVTVRAVLPGISGNIPSGRVWTSSLSGLVITNTAAFSGGQDANAGDPLILEAVLYLAKFFLQNRQFYERTFEMELDDFMSDKEFRKFEMELPAAVYRHIVGLISHARNPKDFIPQVD